LGRPIEHPHTENARTGNKTQRLLDALNSQVRREILWLIWEDELPAGEIAAAFALAGPTISEHLGVLREAGLVTLRSKGTFRWYRARQDAIQGMRGLLVEDKHKWFPGTTPAPMAPSQTAAAIVVTVTSTCSQRDAFRAFTDPVLYSRWAGVPVALSEGRFTATMEWGLEVRGRYIHVVEPSLIVMLWDFESNKVPLPGTGTRAYLEIARRGRGCRLELTQLVRSAEHAAYMERAWGLILGRFRDHASAALNPHSPTVMRPKRTRSTPH
jgi:DNA-binding transcriptional ArsR family regulator